MIEGGAKTIKKTMKRLVTVRYEDKKPPLLLSEHYQFQVTLFLESDLKKVGICTLGPITPAQILPFDLPHNPMGVWTTYLEFEPIIIFQCDKPALPS